MLAFALAVLIPLRASKTECSPTSTPSQFQLFTKKTIVLRSICLSVAMGNSSNSSLTMRNAMWESSLTLKWASRRLFKLITSLSRLNWLNKKTLMLKSTKRTHCSSTLQPMVLTTPTGAASLSSVSVRFETGLLSLTSKASQLTSKTLPRMQSICSQLRSRGSMMLNSTRILSAGTGRVNTQDYWMHLSWQSLLLRRRSRSCTRILDSNHSSQWER